MKKSINISGAEWEVMNLLWKNGSSTATEIIESLKNTNRSPKTIRTLLDRLVRKGIISFRQEKVYMFYPLLSEKECQRTERRSFIQRVYRGSFKPLLVGFLEEEELSQEDIAELKRILDEKTN